VGAGTTGHGIAYVAATAGHDVALVDITREALEHGLRRLRGAFDSAVGRARSSPADRDDALSRVRAFVALPDAVRDADVVIEAVPERLELKQAVFADLERHAPRTAVLATSSSSLRISEIARPLTDRGRALGMHFFSPVPATRLVELVRGEETADDAVRLARRFAEGLGKTSVVVRDTPGFATSRLGVVLALEAIRMLEQGVASAEDIDRAMALGYNHPMGPLRLSDLVGLDVRLAAAEHLHASLGADTYRAPELLRRLVAEGKLGRKTGVGFYRWEIE
jgi:3-hydroxybutyryl-CoA dehydrogenase